MAWLVSSVPAAISRSAGRADRGALLQCRAGCRSTGCRFRRAAVVVSGSRLRATAGLPLKALGLDALRFFRRCAGRRAPPARLIGASTLGLLASAGAAGDKAWTLLPASRVRLADSMRTRPCCRLVRAASTATGCCRIFRPSGASILRARRAGATAGRQPGGQLDLVLLFRSRRRRTRGAGRGRQLPLNCSPAIQPVRAPARRVQVNQREPNSTLVADRTRPSDYEIYDLLG